jgi:hypothetical protein
VERCPANSKSDLLQCRMATVIVVESGELPGGCCCNIAVGVEKVQFLHKQPKFVGYQMSGKLKKIVCTS